MSDLLFSTRLSDPSEIIREVVVELKCVIWTFRFLQLEGGQVVASVGGQPLDKMRLPCLVALVCLASPAIRAAVLAIDYGAEFTKLSLVKPGVPFDVVLDRDSKRKIQSVVGWKRDDRVFGQEGKMAVS